MRHHSSSRLVGPSLAITSSVSWSIHPLSLLLSSVLLFFILLVFLTFHLADELSKGLVVGDNQVSDLGPVIDLLVGFLQLFESCLIVGVDRRSLLGAQRLLFRS